METPPPIEEIDHHYAAVFIVTESGKVVGQKRDDKPEIDNPGKISAFGGTVEPGEQPQMAAWRELTQEETNLKVDINAIKPLVQDVSWRKLTSEWEVRHFFYVRIKDDYLADMEVYEGQGWVYINSPQDNDLIKDWAEPVKKILELVN